RHLSLPCLQRFPYDVTRVLPRGRPFLRAASIVAVLISCASLAAGPSAMARFQEGMSLYKAGKFKEALVAFEDAYKLKPGGGILRKMAECREKTGDLTGARESYVTYLKDAAAPDRDAVQKELDRIDAKLKAEQAPPTPPIVAAPPPEPA